jgi:leader peptidase (prepilin peptidase)/N-methyltransferase
MRRRPRPAPPFDAIDHPSGEEARAVELDLRPHPLVLIGGTAAVAAVSFASLAWPEAIASTVLGALMIAGAEVDARTFLLPDTVTLGALASGLLAAFALDPIDPVRAAGEAALRAAVTAAILFGMRWAYARLRGREGLGLGDIKLAAGIGAWLSLGAIPICFAFAACGALALVLLARLCGRPMNASTKLPLGAFLCPALWLVFFVGALTDLVN